MLHENPNPNRFIKFYQNELSNCIVGYEENDDVPSNTVGRTRVGEVLKGATNLVNIEQHLYHLEQKYTKV